MRLRLGNPRGLSAWPNAVSKEQLHELLWPSTFVTDANLPNLGSKNGTFLKGEAVSKPCPLSDGDRVLIGTVEMTVRRYVGGVSTQSVRSR